jgi:large subunit ribosomal protein L32e
MEKKSSKLKERRLRKKAKPVFLRQDGHKLVKLSKNWRRPRGLHNKVRLNKRGYRRNVTVGWKSPALVRGLSRGGLEMKVVHTVAELGKLASGTHTIIIAKSVGTKRRVEIVTAAIEKKLPIQNIKDPSAYLATVQEQRKKIKEEEAKRLEKKEKEKKAAEKKKATEEKKTVEKPAPDKGIEAIAEEEEKKEQDKKAMDKVLTQKV